MSDTLLLARGACIETRFQTENRSHQKLLLARGACIETEFTGGASWRPCCSSQEEHVLKQYVLSSLFLTSWSCSSQEEHVLKPSAWKWSGDQPEVAPRKRSMY